MAGARQVRMRRALSALGLTAGTVAVLALAPLGSAAPAATGGEVRAVVTFSGAGPVTAPGITVRAVFPHVGAQLVTGSAERVRALATDPRVRGISPDDDVTFTSNDRDDTAEAGSVFAWEGIEKAGRPNSGGGVTVALLDTGVSDTPALNRASGRLVDGVDTSRLRTGGAARTSGTFTDGYGHGTFMANLIAGGQTEGTGKRGLGVAPGARVVVVKVADDQGTTSLSQVLAGFDWVAAQAPKIQVVSVALGHPRPRAAYGADPLTAAVEHVTESGVLVVAASGNTPGQVEDPGLAPRAITIGAADLTAGVESVAPFSGSGNVSGVRKPDVVASGVGLLSLMPTRSVIARTYPQALQPNGFYRGSGTSESTAVTAGGVAVLLSGNPRARLVDVKPALRVSAEPILGGAAQGQGLLDLDKAFKDLRAYDRHSAGDPSGESALDVRAWERNSWLDGAWEEWLEDAWSANSWSEQDWAANSWSANSWSANSWSANSWSANSWAANSWSANSWAANSWSANSWAANSWAANSWAANSWAANSWAANSWAANSWAANSWAANSWAANSWAANSWAAQSWGADR